MQERTRVRVLYMYAVRAVSAVPSVFCECVGHHVRTTSQTDAPVCTYMVVVHQNDSCRTWPAMKTFEHPHTHLTMGFQEQRLIGVRSSDFRKVAVVSLYLTTSLHSCTSITVPGKALYSHAKTTDMLAGYNHSHCRHSPCRVEPAPQKLVWSSQHPSLSPPSLAFLCGLMSPQAAPIWNRHQWPIIMACCLWGWGAVLCHAMM